MAKNGKGNNIVQAATGAAIAIGVDFAVEQFHIPILNDMSPLGPDFSNVELLLYGSGLLLAISKNMWLGAGLVTGTLLYEKVLSTALRRTVPVG